MSEESAITSFERLLWSLDELADKAYQESAWLGKMPGVTASFQETVCEGLSDIEKSLDNGRLDTIYSPELCAKARAHSSLLNRVSIHSDIETMIQSEPMIQVRKASAELAALIRKEGPPPGGWFGSVPFPGSA